MKRFSDTTRFEDPWYCSLPIEMKVAWEYIWAKCDNAGVWIANTVLADFQIGKKVDWSRLLKESDGRLTIIGKDKWAITGFVFFQCGKLLDNCRPHQSIVRLLESHGIRQDSDGVPVLLARSNCVSDFRRAAVFKRDGNSCVYCGSKSDLRIDHIVPRLQQGTNNIENLLTACHDCNSKKNDKDLIVFLEGNPNKDRVLQYVDTLSDFLDSPKDKDKDQEEDKEKEKEAPPKKNKATLDEVTAFAKELGLPQSDGVSCFHKWEGNGWTNGKAKIVCWKSTIRAWKAAGYLPSQKAGGFAQPAKPAAPLKTRAQFIGEAGSRKMKLLPGEVWPKNPDGSDQTTDQVGNAAYQEYLKAQ